MAITAVQRISSLASSHPLVAASTLSGSLHVLSTGHDSTVDDNGGLGSTMEPVQLAQTQFNPIHFWVFAAKDYKMKNPQGVGEEVQGDWQMKNSEKESWKAAFTGQEEHQEPV